MHGGEDKDTAVQQRGPEKFGEKLKKWNVISEINGEQIKEEFGKFWKKLGKEELQNNRRKTLKAHKGDEGQEDERWILAECKDRKKGLEKRRENT